jgi:hypothetical protein
MAESAAQRRSRIMKERIASAKTRTQSTREDAAVENTVAPSAPTTTPTPTTKETATTVARANSRENATTPKGSNFPKTWTKSLGPKPQAKVYQKHVLFALASAFIIQLVANGKSLPIKGK